MRRKRKRISEKILNKKTIVKVRKQSRIRFKQTMLPKLMQNSWKIIMQIQNGKKIIFSMPMATI